MPSCGCLMPTKNLPERKEKQLRRKKRSMRHLISYHGKITPRQLFQTKKNRSRQLSKKCLRNSGPLSKIRTRKLNDKSSSSIEKETLNLSITIRRSVNYAKFKLMQISSETRNYSMQILSEKRPSSIWKKPRRLSVEEKYQNYKITTNKVPMTRQPLKNLSKKKWLKRLKDNIK